MHFHLLQVGLRVLFQGSIMPMIVHEGISSFDFLWHKVQLRAWQPMLQASLKPSQTALAMCHSAH